MTHLATEANSGRADPQQARPPSKPAAKSHLTVRLPDLNAGRATARADAATASHSKIGRIDATATAVETSPSPATAAPSEAPPATMNPLATESSSFAPRTPFFGRAKGDFLTKAIAFVRQPKFWLACFVFAGVQVVLALVVTPREEDYGQAERLHTAPQKWTAPDSTPAARLVVPAAPTPMEAMEAGDGPADGTTTPMGLSVPLEPAGDAQSTASEPLAEAPGAGPASRPMRVAENRRLSGDGGQLDGRSVREAHGATLGGIVPLGPTPETNSNEQP